MHTTRTTALGRIALATRIAAAAATVCAAQLAAAQSTLPSGVGIYLNVATLSAHGYNGNGSSDYASGPGISIYSGGGTNSSGGPLYAMTSAPLPLGATVGTLSAQGSDEPDHPVTATAASTADMSTGVLRVNAGGSGRGIAGAQMKDNLNFHVAGGGTADVTVTVHLDGSFALFDPLYASGSQAMGLGFAGAAFSEVGGASDVNGPSSYYGHNSASGYVPPYGWVSYSFSNESSTGFDFTGVVQVTDGQHAGLNFNLGTDCFKAGCDFGHTGTFGLVLSDGVSFTSDSGVFLSANASPPPIAAVPEPQTWALMLGGIAFAGFAARRKLPRA